MKKKTLPYFDFVVAVFLNIGDYNRGRDGSTGDRDPEFFTLPKPILTQHYLPRSNWDKVSLKGLDTAMESFKNKLGFEQIAKLLGIHKPTRIASDDAEMN